MEQFQKERRNDLRLRIFTDGACSKNPGKGGWAALFNLDNSSEIISGNEADTTNNRMELKAVASALHKISTDSNYKDYKEIEIYSDSAYVINAINCNWLGDWVRKEWKTTRRKKIKNKDIWENIIEEIKFLEQKRNMNIKFIKIKGHDGNTFNEIVDACAKNEILKIKEN